ncbi:MAG TPA: aldehyde ferredoxin oxidoreductase C-terminal domain-containing protein, partial [Thermodesulfobacteriota bacterium]|nr:aldehyde ferredoxin oxidoreductase C-terminal domain-containing protein [Thermodesulfobacteriota bacterium]
GTQIGGNYPICEWLNAAAGWENSPEEYLVIGERIEQLRQGFNLREGLNPKKDFRVHPRLSGASPVSGAPTKGITLDVEALTNGFYQALSWDRETGRPDRERLIRLGLEEVVDVLYKQG